METQHFMVVRQDDNGCRYAVADKLSQYEADLLALRLSARGHKQTFFVQNWTTAQQRRDFLMCD
jgi:hypothetical protein